MALPALLVRLAVTKRRSRHTQSGFIFRLQAQHNGHLRKRRAQDHRASMLLHQRRQHDRSEEHTSEFPSLIRISYAVFCLKKKTTQITSKNQQVTYTTIP